MALGFNFGIASYGWKGGGASPSAPATQRALLAFGNPSDGLAYGVNIVNLISNTGVVATDTTTTGSGKYYLSAAGYGGDLAIFAFGTTGFTGLSTANLVSNSGVVASDSATVATGRYGNSPAAGYGADKAIFGWGTGATQTNLVSNTGVIASDVAFTGTVRSANGTRYGGDKAMFVGSGIVNYITNTGVVGADVSIASITNRNQTGATNYGSTGQAILVFGYDAGVLITTNLISNTGVVGASSTSSAGTGKFGCVAAGYGGDKAIVGFGSNSSFVKIGLTNLISNTGVVAADTAAVGTPRGLTGAAGYSLT